MTELPQPTGLIGSRERRWLLAFLGLGTAYFAILVGEFVLRVLGAFSSVLLILFLAWLLAFVMSPAVRFLVSRLPLPRAAIVILIYAVALVALGFGLFYTGSAVTAQLADLTETFPQTAERIRASLASWQEGFRIGRLDIDLVAMFDTLQQQAGVIGGAILAQAQWIAGVTVAALAGLALVIVISMYMVMDADRIRAKIRRVVPSRFRDELSIFERSVSHAFGGFIRAQVILALVGGLLVAAIWLALGLPYLFIVAILSGIAMLIPFFGPIIAFVPPAATAAIYRPEAVVWVVAILFVAQLPIVNWLQPRLMQNALGVHPILVLVGLLVGYQAAGVWGALFGIPAVAVVNVFFNYLADRSVPNVLLPERERLDYVEQMTLVRVEKEQIADDTHPSIHVHRSLRPDGTEQIELEVPDEERREPRGPSGGERAPG